ncbi:hypothetical protein [Clostridium beijerinckii]|jgi:hypothetical protein|uniref:Uncharacterized protein n=2 Tax=Clostridium beijerinckii TaxID=1520 RepID=A0AB74VKV5_CLOBE|nr:hypothetical protein [Clostridium beijerinckii]MBC2460467.1 hypothetical protein [Clostridium beijerinckii]MBC2477943.1 hypothetical protein [Clostridium beijerinckii]MCI1581406.1 hypothetical protein [Clostridium beijerinckii]MCI1585646.1 hypothetical protein [Clostridium beijerinckii]MCI1624945.1 hypothetical protein [Clostridium beijerinckii]
MDKTEHLLRHVEENKQYKQQIKKLKNKIFLAKILKYALRLSNLLYVVPIILILFIFRNNRLIGAFISIAYFYTICMLLKLDENSRIMRFLNEYSDSNRDIKIYEQELKIKKNELYTKSR